jgi:hypothetical protein
VRQWDRRRHQLTAYVAGGPKSVVMKRRRQASPVCAARALLSLAFNG